PHVDARRGGWRPRDPAARPLIASERRTRAQQSGDRGEERAAQFLERRGLSIVSRNYRTRHGEIDLIAREGEVLVFVEVRLRAEPRCRFDVVALDGEEPQWLRGAFEAAW